MTSVKLDKNRHDRKRFDCGVDALNNYLKLMANQQSQRDNSRTYVLKDEQNPNYIIGFYTLTMVTLNLNALPSSIQNKHHNTHSAGLIARLAVDRRYTGQGFGAWLLVDALKKLLSASETVGFPLVVVDAKEGATSFYEAFGFTPFVDEERKLFITVGDIRRSFGA
ncbi:MAG TPA: GNAT family N-acetyltransferase [Campylobacterales bacterium]|nr:GNAT family N-acetyltransferase [Campylobacterales bacterium]